jgi:glucose-1-phosphate thymidylyltransferase
MIEYVLAALVPIRSLEHIYIVVNQKFFRDFRVWAADYRMHRATHRFSLVNDGSTGETDKLGAIGDLHFTLQKKKIDDDVIVVAGDNLFSETLAGFGEFCRTKKAPVLGVYDVGNLEDIKRYNSIEVGEKDRITFFQEKPTHPKSTLTGVALYFYPKFSLPLIRQYVADGNNPDQPGRLVQWMYPRVPFYTWKVPGTWHDIGSKETLQEANEIFARR